MRQNNIFKLIPGTLLIMFMAFACQKQATPDRDRKLATAGEKSPTATPKRLLEDCTPANLCTKYDGTVVGANQTPGPPPYTIWGHKYYSFGENAQKDPPNNGCAEIDFNSIFNSTITATSGWKIGYIQVLSAEDIDDIECCWGDNTINSSSLDMVSIGENTAGTPGWFNYDITTHIPTPVANRFIVVWSDVDNSNDISCGDIIYVMQVTSVTTNPAVSPTNPGPYQPTYQFEYKRIQVCCDNKK